MATKFAGGYAKARPRGGTRTGNVGVTTFAKSTPFTGNTSSRLRGTRFAPSRNGR